MSDTKFLLRDARDQINLELRKASRRVSAEVYAELEADILSTVESNVEIDISPQAIRGLLVEAIHALPN